jgi:uncharacterized protein YdaU (DUF1376 family)
VARTQRCKTFDFNPSDFLNDPNVVVMDAEQRGVYIALLCSAWEQEIPGILPAEDHALMRLARATPEEWGRTKHAVSRCFDVSDGRWIQKRMVREYETQNAWFKRQSAAGKRGAKSRWGKKKDGVAMKSLKASSMAPPITNSLLSPISKDRIYGESDGAFAREAPEGNIAAEIGRQMAALKAKFPPEAVE